MQPAQAQVPSLFERLLVLVVKKASAPGDDQHLTTRPEWVSGQRPAVHRPFRRRAYHEASCYERPPVSYGPYHPYNLD